MMITDVFKNSSEDKQKKFCELFLTQFESDTFTKPEFDFQAIWTRSKYGVSTCSNHVESCHSKLNQKVANLKAFDLKLNALLNFLNERRNAAIQRPNFKRVIAAAKKKPIHYINHEVCEHDPWLIYKQNLFGEYPCPHQLLGFKIKPLEQIKQQVSPPIDVQSCTKVLPTTSWVFHRPSNHNYTLTPEEIDFANKFPVDERQMQKLLHKIPHSEQYGTDFLTNLFIHFTKQFTTTYDYNSTVFIEYAVIFQIQTKEEAEKIAAARMAIQKHQDEIEETLNQTPNENPELEELRESLSEVLNSKEETRQIINSI